MIEGLLAELVPGVGPWATLLLLLAGALGAFITTAFGAGGGVFLLALLSALLPIGAVVPVHGVLQAGSNGLRTAWLYRSVRWSLLAVFVAGGIVGTAIGAGLFVQLPGAWLEIALGGFILWSCWGPRPRFGRSAPSVRLAAGGAVTGALTVFVGATGPFVAALLRGLRLPREAHMATFSACMLLQHGVKIAAFGLLGFAFAPWLGFIGAMLAMAALGTWLGRRVLRRLGDERFRWVLAVVLTLLALRLLASGALGVTTAG